MKILILNSGSSSIKFQIIDMPNEEVLCHGLVERIGQSKALFHYKTSNHNTKEELPLKSHAEGLQLIAKRILSPEVGVLNQAQEITAVGHRVVHGANLFSDTQLIDQSVKKAIKSLFSLAPLHNPANYEGIVVAEKVFSHSKQIAVFDTAFHQTIPQKAYQYAIPQQLLDQDKIRLYGFHGTSHKYVSQIATKLLNKKQSKIISIHLGNGCSITAIKNGKSIDHSLGFTPSNGLVMGTRSGDIDHSIIYYLIDKLGYSINQINDLLNNKSGMQGLTGQSDLRDIIAMAQKGNLQCQLALDINTYRIKKYIGSYVASMNGVDAIIFTAGIGENSAYIREKVCSDLSYLGIVLDTDLNNKKTKEVTAIEATTSLVKILIIPTNEELEIAKQCYSLLS